MAVTIYLSSVPGSTKVRKDIQRMQFLLNLNRIEFTEIDISTADGEEHKNYMHSKSGKKILPQLFVDGEFKGMLEDLEDANEQEQLKQFLAIE